MGTVLELLLRAQDYEGNGVADDAPPLAMLRLADEITVSAPNQRVAWKRSEQWGTSRLSPVRPVRPERTFPVLVVIPARVEGPLVAKIHAQVGHRLLIFAVGGGLKITSVSGSKTNWNVALPKSSFLQNRTSVWVKIGRSGRLHDTEEPAS